MRSTCLGAVPLILCLLASGVGETAAVTGPCCEGFGRFGWAPTDGVLVGSLSLEGTLA